MTNEKLWTHTTLLKRELHFGTFYFLVFLVDFEQVNDDWIFRNIRAVAEFIQFHKNC